MKALMAVLMALLMMALPAVNAQEILAQPTADAAPLIKRHLVGFGIILDDNPENTKTFQIIVAEVSKSEESKKLGILKMVGTSEIEKYVIKSVLVSENGRKISGTILKDDLEVGSFDLSGIALASGRLVWSGTVDLNDISGARMAVTPSKKVISNARKAQFVSEGKAQGFSGTDKAILIKKLAYEAKNKPYQDIEDTLDEACEEDSVACEAALASKEITAAAKATAVAAIHPARLAKLKNAQTVLKAVAVNKGKVKVLSSKYGLSLATGMKAVEAAAPTVSATEVVQ